MSKASTHKSGPSEEAIQAWREGKAKTGESIDGLHAAHSVIRRDVAREIAEWIRGDYGEGIRANAIDAFVPPEDALADAIEREFIEP